MPYAPATLQAKADAVKALGAAISLHTADMSANTTGANEASGSGYGRVATTWTSGSGGNVSGTAVTITAGAATYAGFGVWSATTAGTFIGGANFSGGSVTISGGTGSVVVTPSIAET
jgi:hypothetical protein